MNEYKISVIAGTKLLAEMVESVKDATYGATIEIEPVPPGPLPQLAEGIEKKMIVGAGKWTWKGIVLKNPYGIDGVPDGNEGTLWFDGADWKIVKVEELPTVDTANLATKVEVKDIENTLDEIYKSRTLNLVFNKNAFNNSLVEISGASYVNNGSLTDVTLYRDYEIEIISNAYGNLYCGWKDASGVIISVFQTSTDATARKYTGKVPSNASSLYLSRWNSYAAVSNVYFKKFASKESEVISTEALIKSTNNDKAIKLLQKEIDFDPIFPTMKFRTYFTNLLVETSIPNDLAQTAVIDVTAKRGSIINIFIRAAESAYCGWKDSEGVVISVFQISIFSKYSTKVPLNASFLYLSNYDTPVSVNLPYIVYRSKEESVNLFPYVKGFRYTTLTAFFKQLANKTKSPLNLLYGGDSIVNFQNTGIGSVDYEVDSLRSPAFLYNKNTFMYKAWQSLNPNSLDANGNVIKDTGNLTIFKANDMSVTKSGNWISNYTGSTYNALGSYNSSPPNSVQELLHSKLQGDFMEITLPVGTTGFSIVCKKFNGAKTDGTTSTTASTMKIYIDNVLRDTVSLVGSQTMYFDYTITKLTVSAVIKIENAESKWLPVWGFEYWSDTCIRPINTGIASSTIGSWYGNTFKEIIKNLTPDLIIHEANIINDRSGSLEVARLNYKLYLEDVQARGIPIIMFITHRPSAVNALHTAFARMVIEMCKAYNIPYINVWKYLEDKYNKGTIPTSLYIDGTHLSTAGHEVYTMLINESINQNY